MSFLELHRKEHDDETYFMACEACEVYAIIPDVVVHRQILACLVYDKRDYGSRGRRLTRDFLALGLRTNDRLEPSAKLIDV
eukprot:4126484-Karenia_brevis.AAC.1